MGIYKVHRLYYWVKSLPILTTWYFSNFTDKGLITDYPHMWSLNQIPSSSHL